MLIQGTFGYGGLGCEPLDTGSVYALLVEEPDGGIQDSLARSPSTAPGRGLHVRCCDHH
jgi:hypothetical protein